MFEQTDPKTLVKWLILAALVYLVFPYDFLPDFIGLPGRIDDLLLMAWLAWFYRSKLRAFAASGSEAFGRAAGSESKRETPGAGAVPRNLDAHEVLGIPRSASNEAIRAAYRRRMQEYHPDKVAHLGEDLQRLAHEKSQEIQRAYQQLHS